MHLHIAAAAGEASHAFCRRQGERVMAKDVPIASPRFNVAASIRDLRRELRQVLGSLEGVIGKIEQIEEALKLLEKASTGCAGISILTGASRLAYNLEILPRADGSGSVEFSIDGRSKFSLGPRLAEVFQFIASGDKDRSSADPLVGWRSRSEIIGFLQNSTGKLFRKSYVNNMVHLLRDALRTAGYDRNLIQTHKEKGVRLALKRGGRGIQGALPPGW